MQIGQILVAQRWVTPEALTRALAEQPASGMRLCSLLIAHGALEPDNAARALANQHGVPGVLQKHLERRDASLAALVPTELARAHTALPIGRTRLGELIICVCDPRAELAAIFAAAVAGPVVIAVAPATQLTRLVEEAYRAGEEASFEVDLTSRPIAVIYDPVTTSPGGEAAPALAPARGDGLDGLGKMTLVGLDDVGVAKDPSQSGQLAAAWPRAATGSYPPLAPGALAPRTMTRPSTIPAAVPVLAAAIGALERAVTLDEALDAAMRFLAGRFHHAVLFTIHEGAALGDRGHGGALTTEIIQAIAVPLNAPSIVQAAHDGRRLATAAPANAGVIQDRLARLLGHPRALVAAPILVGEIVAQVIAVGDAVSDADTAAHDLVRLAHALGVAHQRAAVT